MRFRNSGPLLIGLFGFISLTGCVTVGPDWKEPKFPAPPSYNGAQDGVPREARIAAGLSGAAWWRGFGSPKLDSMVDRALNNSPTIAQADATLAAADEALKVTQASGLPGIDLTGGLKGQRINPAAFGFAAFPAITTGQYDIGGQVSYDLDLFGGVRRTSEAAQANVEAEANRASAARLTLAGDVVLQALAMAALEAQIQAAEQIVTGDRETLRLSDRLIALGEVADATRLAPAAQLAADQTMMPSLEQQLAIARHGLSILLGETPAESATLTFAFDDFHTPDSIDIVVPSELLRRRPDILAAEAALHSATAQIGIDTAKLYPDINLTASLSQLSLRPEKLFSYDATGWQIGSSLLAPVYHGGALRAQVRRSEAEARAADARYRATVLRAFGEVADALSALRYTSDALSAQQAALVSAEANLHARRRLFELGRGTQLEILDAQRQANIARREIAAAQGRRLQSVAQLYAATATTYNPTRGSFRTEAQAR